MKKKERQKAAWALIGAATAMITGRLVYGGVSRGYRAYYDEGPLEDPANRDFSWVKALAFTAGTAALVSVAQMAAVRGAALGWKKATGKLPPRAS